MLQAPTSSGISLPPSQTPTLVIPMAAVDQPGTTEVTWEPTPVHDPESTMPKVAITFLLLSGKRKTVDFDQTDSFAKVRERLYEEWPLGEQQHLAAVVEATR